ncbi:cysteine hydrolase family protein [Celerinatantimonas diazotrophica]|uniref:Nicotinamidase-related amidase n=1 Tax=Celerinatantimonas diazotrophica TaxID=412034 RepID=A0A4R1J954_9GAMM|nr:cysteine hydrolase family protein [Celerinatantimonas diazotrophica]TCK47108.1 nicotinamidase-related amidase [Celerinatantimonas diazotrophica]CAG9295877.1 Peroxyureidoacrylate/ureidoacrylate amidohydrolase RutB [Celerinatantimonas diazotrophica]
MTMATSAAQLSALLVIDMQRVLFEPSPQPYQAEPVVARINRATTSARQMHMPVIFIQHEEPHSEIDYQSDGWQLLDSIMHEDGDIYVRKTTPDSFLRTNLQNILQELGIKQLYVCGYASEFCVDTTVRRAAALGYDVTLLDDAHTTHDKVHANGDQIREHQNRTLTAISSFGVTISAISIEQFANA